MTDTSKLNVEISTDKAKKDADKLTDSLDKMEKKGDKAGKSVKKTGEEAKKAGGGFDSLKAAVAGVFTIAAIRGITRTIAEFETLRFSLGIVFDEMDRGTAVFRDIQKIAEITPFGVNDLTESVIKLRAAGIEPTVAQLTLFSDTASVTGDAVGSLQAITDLFARTTAGGLGLEDLNRLADRGIPVFTILSERLGLSRLEVSKLGQTAEGAAQILDALTKGLDERFGGASQKAANLLTTTISNMGDTWDRFQDSLGEAGGTTILVTTISAATTALGFFADNLDLVAIGVTGMATLALPLLIKGVKALTLAMKANPVGLIVTGITIAVAAIWHFREVIYEAMIKVFEVTLPNAIDRANIGFLEMKKGVGDLMNGILGEIESFANNMINKTPDWLKKFFGIDKDPFSFVIDTDSVAAQIEALEKEILDRTANFKPPELPAFLQKDDEKGGAAGEGLSTGSSLTGNLVKGGGVTGAVSSVDQERAQKSLEALEKSLLNEEERLFDSYANRQFIVEDAFENELISSERQHELLIGLKEQYETDLTKIQVKGATEREKFEELSTKSKIKFQLGSLAEMTAGAATENRKMFEVNKALALANAAVTLPDAVLKSWNNAGGFPWGIVPAGLMLAAGLTQIQAIKNSSFGGSAPSLSGIGGGASTVNVVPIETPLPDDSENSGTTINVIIEGSAIGNENVRDVIIDAVETAQANDEIRIIANG